MKFDKRRLILYAITDRVYSGNSSLQTQLKSALEGGVTMVQLREKAMPKEDFIREAKLIKRLCSAYSVPLIINDSLEVALKSGADGVHVGKDDEAAHEIRKKTGDGFIIGVTAKSLSQALQAEKDGADYLGVGAVFPSPTKTKALAVSLEDLKLISGAVEIPVVAIGGLGLDNLNSLKNCGISGIAVISSLFASADIKLAAELLKAKSEEILG